MEAKPSPPSVWGISLTVASGNLASILERLREQSSSALSESLHLSKAASIRDGEFDLSFPNQGIAGCAHSPDGKWFVTAVDGALRLWRSETDSWVATLAENLALIP